VVTRAKTTPIWPFLVVLTGLFVLVAAPRSWRAGARPADRPMATRPPAHPVAALPEIGPPGVSFVPEVPPFWPASAVPSPHVAGLVELPAAPDPELPPPAGPSRPPLRDVADLPPLDWGDAPGSLTVPRAATQLASVPSLAPGDLAPIPPDELLLPRIDEALPLPDLLPARDEPPEGGSSAERGAWPDEAPGRHGWPEPAELLAQLDRLRENPAAASWADEVARLVGELTEQAGDGAAGDVGAILDRLDALEREAAARAGTLADRELGRPWARTCYGLRRRLDVWRPAATLPEVDETLATQTVRAKAADLGAALAVVDAELSRMPEGQAWREYLLLDALGEYSEAARAGESGFPPSLAEELLRRLVDTPMSVEQRRFIHTSSLARLTDQVRELGAAAPLGPADLLAELERYEATRLPSDAARLAQMRRRLALADQPEARRLAEWIDAYYRNANLRVAVSEELLNRLVPKRDPEVVPVRDTVLGRPVRGQSTTSADLQIRLLPHPERVRVALEVSGSVSSLTSSFAGPATFYNNSRAVYVARKPLEIDLRGIRAWPAQVDVYYHTRLRDLQTDFDGIPLFGVLAQEVARSQHDANLPAANREVRQKIAARARQRMDEETSEQLSAFARQLHERVLAPIHELSLDPALVGAETDERRLNMRLRLAGEDQLGSHTPRPQAPADSLGSLQVHETAINNALERLELHGRTLSLQQLAERVATRFGLPEPWETAPEHEDVTITFAEENPVEVRCVEGQLVMTLSVARLSKPPRAFRDFQVRAFYVPNVEGRSAELARDEVIHLIGQLNTGSQIVLRGIFSRTFSRERPWTLTPERFVASPEVGDLEITQFVIEDGWVGLALGPRRTAAPRETTAARGPVFAQP
jgi:hypothetical protein